MDEMIERVVRAIWAAEWEEPYPREGTVQHAIAEQLARAAIEAMRECTPRMYQAGEIAAENGSGANFIFAAMIDAALAP